jgi:two-component system sensor histidine kinase VanS
MKISIFLKTFFIILFSFLVLFLGSTYYFYNEFPDKYVEENISAVKNAIINSVDDLNQDMSLASTLIKEATSETQYIRLSNNQIVDQIGPAILQEDEIVYFVVNIYSNDELIVEGKLSYIIEINYDIYTISYLYRIDTSDYLLVITKIQSISNIDKVLNEITYAQGIFIFIAALVLSLLISSSFTRPINKINKYAKSIAKLDFSKKLIINRKDELEELTKSLNEMAFNLNKSYSELNTANNKLKGDIDFDKQQEEKKKQLIMTINHELKTPVSVIKGMVEGMIDGVGRYKEKPKYLKEVLKQLDKIEDLTKDLTYSLKLEDLAKKDDVTNTDVLKGKLDLIKELAKQNKVSLNLKISSFYVNISEELLIILISNLLKNAIKYTRDHYVEMNVSSNNTKVYFEISNGGYINPDDFEKIFEPYYRIDLDSEGQGLGLYIVKQICEIYQGKYKIYNHNGKVITEIELKKVEMS